MDKDDHTPQILPPADLPHEAAAVALHVYAHDVLLGRSPENRDPQLARHVTTCAICQNDLAELLEVTRDASAFLTEPSMLPTPRLDFSRMQRPWRQTKTQQRPRFADQLGQIWIELSEEVLRSWQPLPLLGTARGALLYSSVNSTQMALDSQAQEDDTSLTIDVLAGTAPHEVTLVITVDASARDALNQSGTRVIVYHDQAIAQGTTDSTGIVRFVGLPHELLPRLRICITVGQPA